MVEDSAVLTAEMIAALRCPVCRGKLTGDNGLTCAAGHHFDLAKQGYVHLGSGGRLPEGDTAPMIEARVAIQEAGLFAPLEEALTQIVPRLAYLVADLGAGTGHYLGRVLRERPQAKGIAFDVSKPALRRAARAHPRLGAVLADTWSGLPLADASIDVLLNVFAPRNGPEMRRVLKPDGVLVVVTPAPSHLAELRERARLLDVDAAKPGRLRATLKDFQPQDHRRVRWPLHLAAEQARQIILMGPNAFHGAKDPGPVDTTAEVEITTWTGRPLPIRPARHGAAR